MSRRSTGLVKTVLSTLHYAGADRMLAPFTRGIGAILRLHRVAPAPPGAHGPHRAGTISTHFLEQTIHQVRAAGFEIVSLDEAHFRLIEGTHGKPFACFTFDGAYRDIYLNAYPLFERYGLPFTVFIATDYPDGHGDLWWVALERAVAKVEALEVKIDGTHCRFRCATPADKDATFAAIHAWLRRIPENDARAYVAEWCASLDIDTQALCQELIMTWEEIRELAADARVSVGAHGRRHYALAKLSFAEAHAEIEESVARVARELGRPCRHFSYPYGDVASAGRREFSMVRELGLKTAVTARAGLIHHAHRHAPAALPRISLSGNYQHPRYVKVMLSGAPFALRGLFGRSPEERVDAA
jgi:peptidoglycan/xylan/chitin deacetylase (PgdA/CDA1 family)